MNGQGQRIQFVNNFEARLLAEVVDAGDVDQIIKRQLVAAELGDLREVAQFCRDELSFDYLIDITSIDNFGEEPRFEIVYELYSLTLAVHLRLKLRVSEDAGEVETVSDIWPTANWHEREIYDMMGLRLKGHPDLRRILMWDGYPYFPLRKEFPLEGLPSDMPDVAFSAAAPLEGGPFV